MATSLYARLCQPETFLGNLTAAEASRLCADLSSRSYHPSDDARDLAVCAAVASLLAPLFPAPTDSEAAEAERIAAAESTLARWAGQHTP